MNLDTICAISTPPGVGGIAVARVSGPRAIEIVDSLWRGKRPLAAARSHTAHLGEIVDTTGGTLDQALATVFRAPHSFTGDDVVELSVHGSRWVQRELINTLAAAGCRLAEPGEFTRRAFASGKIDLTQAEAVADIIAADSRAAHRLAITQMQGSISRRLTELRGQLLDLTVLLELELDFAEEDVEFADRRRLTDTARNVRHEIQRLHRSFSTGQAIRDGIPVAIVGATNAGKSSLLNALLDDDRAIVSDIHGTTRDTIEETLELGPYTFRFIDTAGLRRTDNPIEQIGIDRTHRAIERARIILWVTDSSDTAPAEPPQHPADSRMIHVRNKTDLAPSGCATGSTTAATVDVSALTGAGIDRLRDTIVDTARDMLGDHTAGDIILTNARHAQALGQALDSIARVIDALDAGIPADLVAQHLRQTLDHLAAITGAIPSTEILATIFSRFCIGK